MLNRLRGKTKEMVTISRKIKVTFFSAILFGIIDHMFALVNECPHSDVFWAYFGYGAGYTSGRWGLALLGDAINTWFGNYPIPWLYGMCSILFLAVSSVCIVEALEISNEWNCLCISMFMVACPSIISTVAYIFTTPYYCFSIMLTCYAAYLVRKKTKGWFAGILLLTFSLGIYQAYLGLAASMFILFLILDCLKDDTDGKAIFCRAWKYLGILCASVLLYMGIAKLSLKLVGKASLTSYQSINTMGQIQVTQIPKFIIKAFLEFISPAVVDRNGLSMFWSVRISYALLLMILAVLAYRLIRTVQGRDKKILMTIFLLLFPCSVNLIYLMCANGYVHTIMRHAQVMIYIAAIAILEKEGEVLLKENIFIKMKHLMAAVSIVTVISFCIQASQAYFGLNQAFNQVKAYFTVLAGQIKSQEGYRMDMPVAIVGKVNDKTFPTFSQYHKFKTMAGINEVFYYDYRAEEILKYCCGFAPEYIDDTSVIEEMEAFKEMPCYPDYGSIAVLNGTVVVKFNEETFE